MGKHKNFSTHRSYFQQLYQEAKQDLAETNRRVNTLQQKYTEALRENQVLKKKIDLLQEMIEDLTCATDYDSIEES